MGGRGVARYGYAWGVATVVRLQLLSSDKLEVIATTDRRGARLWFPIWVALGLFLLWRVWNHALPAWVWAMHLATGALIVWRYCHAGQSRRHLLERFKGRLVLDGDILEIARVETRVTQWPLLGRPSGCRVSIWGMVMEGRVVELEIARFPGLIEASRLTGELERFFEQAKATSREAPRP